MKRVLGTIAAAGLLTAALAVPATADPAPKVFICHSGHNDQIRDFVVGGDHPGWERRCDVLSRGTGHIIEVSRNAARAHLRH